MDHSQLNQKFVINERWVFDLTQNVLIDLDERCGCVTLKPVAARLLAVLARSAQSIVRRRQLFEEGWGCHGLEVGENSLNQVMHSLRTTFEALDSGFPYIKTLPRIGYSLLVTARPVFTHPTFPNRRPDADISAVASISRLATRSVFDAMVVQQWKYFLETRLPLSLVLFEVDCRDEAKHRNEFQAIRPALNHAAQCMARQLNRAGDLLTLYEHNLIAILLANTDFPGAQHVSRKVRAAMDGAALHAQTGGGPIAITIGMACTAERHYDSLEQLFEAAHPRYCEALSVA